MAQNQIWDKSWTFEKSPSSIQDNAAYRHSFIYVAFARFIFFLIAFSIISTLNSVGTWKIATVCFPKDWATWPQAYPKMMPLEMFDEC